MNIAFSHSKLKRILSSLIILMLGLSIAAAFLPGLAFADKPSTILEPNKQYQSGQANSIDNSQPKELQRPDEKSLFDKVSDAFNNALKFAKGTWNAMPGWAKGVIQGALIGAALVAVVLLTIGTAGLDIPAAAIILAGIGGGASAGFFAGLKMGAGPYDGWTVAYIALAGATFGIASTIIAAGLEIIGAGLFTIALAGGLIASANQLVENIIYKNAPLDNVGIAFIAGAVSFGLSALVPLTSWARQNSELFGEHTFTKLGWLLARIEKWGTKKGAEAGIKELLNDASNRGELPHNQGDFPNDSHIA